MTRLQSFAHYTVNEKIGSGGMGEVFSATDSRLSREVALKMLPDNLAQNPERLARFRREAQVLAALNHPGIAAIYGLESQDKHHALAMELVPGPDLAQQLQKGPLPTSEALKVALQLAEAIEAAHEKGIVHRDLKPANIKLTQRGTVKVLDFGLAKALAEDPAASDYNPSMSPTLTANMTQGNVILGTAAYMSPEQARGGEVDKRADIWAFGVVVVEMLTGKQMFHGETVSDTLASVLKSDIGLEDLPDDLPPAATRLLKRCLQRDPRQRLRDIGDARIALQEVLAGESEEATPVPTHRPSPWPVRAVLGLALIAIVTAGVGFLRPRTATVLPLRKFEIPLDRTDTSASVAFAPKISPDGRFLLYVSQDQIWVRDLATTVSRPLPGTEGARDPFWSPDGEWIGFGTANALMKIDRSGGHSMILANLAGNLTLGSASAGSWNPDGTIFFTTGNTGVLRVSAQAGEVTMHHPPQEGEVDFHELCRLPGDRGWVIVVHTKEDYGQLSLLTPGGKRKQLLAYPGDSLNNPVWSPSGHLLFQRASVANGIWAVPFSLADLKVKDDAFLVAVGGRRPSVSDDGTLVYSTGVRQSQLQIAWFDRQGSELEVIADVQTSRPFPYLSPDGTKLLLAANADDGREVWLYDMTNGTERRLTFEGLRWGTAVWHPDGRRIVAYTEPDYISQLITLDGSEPRREIGPAILSFFSADGNELFYAKPQLARGFDFDIFVLPLDATPEEGRQLVSSPAIEWAPVPSPDGKYLLYVSDESGKQEIYATTYPGLTGRWQVSRGGGGWAHWRGDSKEIYYTTHDEMFAVSVADENGLGLGRPHKLFDRPSTAWSAAWPDGFAVSADGERFVMLKPAPDQSDEQPALVVVQNWYAEFAQK